MTELKRAEKGEVFSFRAFSGREYRQQKWAPDMIKGPFLQRNETVFVKYQNCVGFPAETRLRIPVISRPG